MQLRTVNNFETTLGAVLLSASTSLVLAAGAGATLKASLESGALYDGVTSLAAGQSVYFTLESGTTREIVRLDGPWSNVVADTLGGGGSSGTITRGVDGTAATGWVAGATFEAREPRALFAGFSQLDAAETRTGLLTFADGTARHAGGASFANLAAAATSPAAGDVKIAARSIMSSKFPLFTLVDEYGVESFLAPSPFSHEVALWEVGSNGALQTSGIGGGSTGTASGIAPAPGTGIYGEVITGRLTTATAANSAAGINGNTFMGWAVQRLLSAGRGSWLTMFRFGFGTTALLSTARVYIGLQDHGQSSSICGSSTQEPSAFAGAGNLIGLGADGGDASLSLWARQGSGATNKDLTGSGAVAIAKATGTIGKMYDLYIGNLPGAGAARGKCWIKLVEWAQNSYNPTTLYEGEITATIPTTVALVPTMSVGVGANGGVGSQVLEWGKFVGVARG